MTHIGNLQQFKKGGNWKTFQTQLEAFIALNGIEEDKQTPLLITQISTEVFEELSAACTGNLLSQKFDDLKATLSNLYTPKRNVQLERHKFRARKQKSDESITEYYVMLQTLAKKCNFEKEEEKGQLRDQLIAGTKSRNIKYELLKSAEQEIKKLVTLAETVESADAEADLLSTSQRGVEREAQEGEAPIHSIKTKGKQYTSKTQEDSNRRKFPLGTSGAQIREKKTANPSDACYCCGGRGHQRSECFLRKKFCSECGKQGHIYKICKNKNKTRYNAQNFVDETNVEHDDISSEEDQRYESDFFHLREINNFETLTSDSSDDEREYVKPCFEQVKVNGKFIKMEIDTGAHISAVSDKCYEENFKDLIITPSKKIFHSYNRASIPTIGYLRVNVERKKTIKNQVLYVIKNGGPPIIGRKWLKNVKMWPPNFDNGIEPKHNTHLKVNILDVQPNTEIDKIYDEFPKLFKPGFGYFTKGKLKLELKENAKPIFCQPRRIPLALKPKVEAEIDRLQKFKIIEPVEYSEWGTPIVPVLKEDGSVRLCGDFKVTLNKYLKIDRQPMPRFEDIADVIAGAEIFSKVDLAEAYQQLPLDEDSKKLVVISTHKGLFRYTVLCYGVNTGPGSFQRILSTLLLGIPGVVVVLDDILIAARNIQENIERLRMVLSRLQEAGLRLKKKKCEFFKSEIQYLGHRVSKEGVKPIAKKVQYVKDAPRPKNITDLRSFLGSMNYYSKFIPNLASTLHPLFQCLEKGNFKWTESCTLAFNKIKKCLISDSVLIHFDPRKQLVLTCDASPYGVSAVLSHRIDGLDRPINFASRTLSKAEKNYAHVEKEALSIVFGVKKFSDYLWGNKFLLQTDNAALSRIFHPNKAIPQIAASRLQRWSTFLTPFRYEVRHIKGTSNYADWLSRLPFESTPLKNEHPLLNNINYTYLDEIKKIDFASLDWKKVYKETIKDSMLSKVIRYCSDGWTEREPTELELKPFWMRRDALSVDRNCLLWGHRIIIPTSLRNLVLKELHASHFGVNKMKALARSFVWWPKIDEQIEMITKKCLNCLENSKSPPKIPLTPWAWPTAPWHRVHADFLGPLEGKMILLMIDSHSKWPEAYIMQNMNETTTIATFEDVFSRLGYPSHLVTDNFATFKGDAFKKLMQKGGIRHSTSPPHSPATNGAVENLVNTFKVKIKCLIKDGMTLSAAIKKFLFEYRSIPHTATNKTPASLMLGRELRTRFSILRPPLLEHRMCDYQAKQCENHNGTRKIDFSVGDSVMARDYRGGKEGWAKAKIKEVVVPGVTFVVAVSGEAPWKRHANQLIRSKLDEGQASKYQEIVSDARVQTEPQLRRSERLKTKSANM